MFVADWMTKKVVTVTTDNNIAEAIKIVKEKGVNTSRSWTAPIR